MDNLINKIIIEEIKKIKEKEIDEIVDDKGNIATSKKPTNLNTKGVTQKKTTDEVVKTAHGQSGSVGQGTVSNNRSTRFYGESDLTKTLGFKKTNKKNKDFDETEKYFKTELGLSDEETEEKMDQMGYDENLGDDKLRLVENPKKFIEEYLESILKKKSISDDMVNDDLPEILKKQLGVVKNSVKNNNINIKNVIEFLKNE